MIDKVNVYMCLNIASIKLTAGTKLDFFSSPFFISTSWFLILAEAFRSGHVCYSEEWNGWLRNRSVFVQKDTA